jgi:hypothetical protein
MHKIIFTLALMFAVCLQAGIAEQTLALPAYTTNATVTVAVGDRNAFAKEIDSVKLAVSGKTDTNVLLVVTLRQPFDGLTHTITEQTFSADGSTWDYPRNTITTNCLERFYADAVALSCSFVVATNTAQSTALTNAASVSIRMMLR